MHSRVDFNRLERQSETLLCNYLWSLAHCFWTLTTQSKLPIAVVAGRLPRERPTNYWPCSWMSVQLVTFQYRQQCNILQ